MYPRIRALAERAKSLKFDVKFTDLFTYERKRGALVRLSRCFPQPLELLHKFAVFSERIGQEQGERTEDAPRIRNRVAYKP